MTKERRNGLVKIPSNDVVKKKCEEMLGQLITEHLEQGGQEFKSSDR